MALARIRCRVAVALLLVGCADVAQPPSVVLVLIDRLRKDHSDRFYAREWSFGAFNDGVVLKGRKYLRFFADAEGGVVARRTFDLRDDPRGSPSATASAS